MQDLHRGLQGSAKPCTHKLLYFKHGLFCSRLRGKSGAAGKGEASAASQSAELFSCHMTLKANLVTLILCSSPARAIPQPSALWAVKLKNPPAHRAGPS